MAHRNLNDANIKVIKITILAKYRPLHYTNGIIKCQAKREHDKFFLLHNIFSFLCPCLDTYPFFLMLNFFSEM